MSDTKQVEFVCTLPQPANTIACVASHDHKIYTKCALSLFSCGNLLSGILECSGRGDINFVRNYLVWQFLRTPFEWLVMIDTDIEFTREAMECLLSGADAAVNGAYMKKDGSGDMVTAGCGFTRVHRKVFEVLRDERFAPPFNHHLGTMHDYFMTGATDQGGWISEDVGFWLLAKDIGIVPRLEMDLNLRHWGTTAFQRHEFL